MIPVSVADFSHVFLVVLRNRLTGDQLILPLDKVTRTNSIDRRNNALPCILFVGKIVESIFRRRGEVTRERKGYTSTRLPTVL